MPAAHFFAQNLEQVGLDPEKVQALFERAEREVKSGLLPASQVAIARNGKIGAMQTFGQAVRGGTEKPATDDTRFVIMSSTKAFTSAAAWILMQEGQLRPEDRVVEYIPEFGTNGKDVVTVEQLLIHTSAIPYAPHWQKEWADPDRRLARFAQWKPDHTPGEKFVYHVSANFWPVAAIIEHLSGQRLSEFVRTRIAEPLGLPDLRFGLPPAGNADVADVEWVGAAPTAAEYEKMGVKGFNATTNAINEDAVLELNETVTREAGSPSAGCITTAGDIALFYQALLNDGRAYDGTPVWQPDNAARGAARPHRRAARSLSRPPGQSGLGDCRCRRRRQGQYARLRAHQFRAVVRPSGLWRPERLGRPGHGYLVRLSDQRVRPARHP